MDDQEGPNIALAVLTLASIDIKQGYAPSSKLVLMTCSAGAPNSNALRWPRAVSSAVSSKSPVAGRFRCMSQSPASISHPTGDGSRSPTSRDFYLRPFWRPSTKPISWRRFCSRRTVRHPCWCVRNSRHNLVRNGRRMPVRPHQDCTPRRNAAAHACRGRHGRHVLFLGRPRSGRPRHIH